jgi:osmoprotectant transport system substrate-binding protein
LIAELYAQVLEDAGFPVARHFRLGTRQDRVPALEQGQVDLVPEYVGSGLGYYEASLITGDGATNAERLQEILAAKGITVLDFTPGEDTNIAAVRPDTAESFGLTSMSDLAPVQEQLIWGLPPDCDQNPVCKGALEEYGISYPPDLREALAACESPIGEALEGGAIDIAWLCSTHPAISIFDLVELEDDLDTQPAENIAPLVRDDYLSRLSNAEAFVDRLNSVSALLTTEELIGLGVQVEVERRGVEEVAAEWLAEQGLVG